MRAKIFSLSPSRMAGSGDLATAIALLLGSVLLAYVRPRRLGRVTGADGVYQFPTADTGLLPDAGFYLWADVSRTGLSDTGFAARLLAEQNVTVLPGSYLAREADGINPGANRVRMALVATPEECLEGARRIVAFCKSLG